MGKVLKCKQTIKKQFTEGKSYTVREEYDNRWVIVYDDSGASHHVDTTGEFYSEHFE